MVETFWKASFQHVLRVLKSEYSLIYLLLLNESVPKKVVKNSNTNTQSLLQY